MTLTGGYQNDTAGPASFGIQLNVAGASSDVITSFTSSPTLTGCAESAGNIITCSWNPAAQGDTATITATVVVPGDAVGQAWQGDASSGNMGLGTDILEIVAPSPTTTTTTTTTTAPPAETTTTVAGETTTTAAAAGGGATTTTRPRSAALPATGSASPGLAIAAAALVLAGGLIVVGARRRHAD